MSQNENNTPTTEELTTDGLELVEEIRELLESDDGSRIVNYYAVGEKLRTALSAPNKYGKGTLKTYTEKLNLGTGLLYHCKIVADRVTRDELEDLRELRNNDGHKLTWGHIHLIARTSIVDGEGDDEVVNWEETAKARKNLLTQWKENNWNCSQMDAFISSISNRKTGNAKAGRKPAHPSTFEGMLRQFEVQSKKFCRLTDEVWMAEKDNFVSLLVAASSEQMDSRMITRLQDASTTARSIANGMENLCREIDREVSKFQRAAKSSPPKHVFSKR